MPLPSFTFTGSVFDILGNVAANELVENGFGVGGRKPATVTFTPNIRVDQFVTWNGHSERVKPVVATINSSGQILRNGDTVRLLANDPDLSVSGVQYRVDVDGMKPFVFDAPNDGDTKDFSTVVPVAFVGATPITAGNPSFPVLVDPGPPALYQWQTEAGEFIGAPQEIDLVLPDAVLNTDTTTAGMDFVIDEDDMASDLATKVPTQQSVKAYVDGKQTLFNAADYVTSTPLATDAHDAIVAAFNAMKQSGCATGKLLIPKGSVIATTVDLDGGFTNVGNESNFPGVGDQQFIIEGRGLEVASGVGTGLKLHGFYGLHVDLSFRGGGSSSDVAVEFYNLHLPDIAVEAMNFAGTVFKMDVYDAGVWQRNSRRVTAAHIRKIAGTYCGQTLYIRGVDGFGPIDLVWDNFCVNGSYFGFCADVGIKHYETYSPATQTVGVTFEGCNMFGVGTINVGDSATEAMVKILGNTASPAGVTTSCDFGTIERIYVTGARPSYPTENTLTGVKLVDVHSVSIDNIVSDYFLKGVDAIGSNFTVKQHHSATSDTRALVISGDAFNASPVVDVGMWASYTDKQPVQIDSSVTGGRIRIHGYFAPDIYIIGSRSGQPIIDSASTGTLDVAGLTSDAYIDFASLTNHPGSLIGQESAHYQASPPAAGTLWASDGSGNLTALAPGTEGIAPPAVLATTSQVQLANSSAATQLVTYNPPTVIAGMTYRIRVGGTIAQGTDKGTLTFFLDYFWGGTQLITPIVVAANSAPSATAFALDFELTFRTSNAASVPVATTGRAMLPSQLTPVSNVATVNTFADSDLVFWAQWATADAANILNVEQATVERVK